MKTFNIWLYFTIVAISQALLVSCEVEDSLDSSEPLACSSISPVASFVDDFETGQSWPLQLNTNGKWGYEIDPKYGDAIDANSEPVQVSPIMIDSTFSRAGNNSVKFTVNPGDVVADGNRAELKQHPDDSDVRCSEAWYAWSIYIPDDYLSPTANNAFQLIGQFHGINTPPPLFFHLWPKDFIYNDDNYDKIVLMNAVEKDGQIEYSSIAEHQIIFGDWLDIVLHIKWSVAEDGFVEAWYRNVPDPYNVTTSYEPVIFPSTGNTRFPGPTMLNLEPNYFKIGLYRDESIAGFSDTTGIVYYDEVRRGNSFEEVAIK